jgi:hypothetical protein
VGVGSAGGLDLNGDPLSVEHHQQVDLVAADSEVAVDDDRTAAFEEGGGDVLAGTADGHAVSSHRGIMRIGCDTFFVPCDLRLVASSSWTTSRPRTAAPFGGSP